MEKLVWLAMVVAGLSIFNACEKSDEQIGQSVDGQPLEAVKPDVYVENGILNSIKPVIDMLYGTVSNADGFVKINGKLIDAKNIVRLKSVDNCYTKTSKRRMWVEVTRFGPGTIMNEYVSHQKKVVFAWVSYQTEYYWELENPPYGYYSTHEIPSGVLLAMPTNGTNYLKIWNRRVGETNACTFVK